VEGADNPSLPCGVAYVDMQEVKSKSFDQDNKAVCLKVFARFTKASAERMAGMGGCKVKLEDKLLALQETGASKKDMSRVREMLGLVKRELRSEDVLISHSTKIWTSKCSEFVD
jgi:hypothetical protein